LPQKLENVTVKRTFLRPTLNLYLHTTAFLYLAVSLFIMTLDLIPYSSLKDALLVWALIVSPLSVLGAPVFYLLRRKSGAALGWWFALVFLLGNLATSGAYLFLPTGMQSVWDPIGGYWGVTAFFFTLVVALPMSLIDIFSKHQRWRGLAGITIAILTLPLIMVVTQLIIASKQLGFK
jgi:hypothetical protein